MENNIIEHYLIGEQVLEPLDISEVFEVKLTDVHRMLKVTDATCYKVGNRTYYPLAELVDKVAEWKKRFG